MDNYNEDYNWDDQYYGTGPTRPPKSRGGIIALMLIMIIFLCGVATVLGVLNVRLFRQLRVQEQAEELSISFTTEATVPEEAHAPVVMSAEPAPTEANPAPFDSLNLEQTPQSVENIPVEGGLSLQEIYARNIHSAVSISCVSISGSSTGSGVVLSRDGYIVTNAHVVEDAISITVCLTDERCFEADLVGSDEISDLAVLYVPDQELSPAQFGDSTQLRVGDSVAAIGDPLGLEFRGTYTNGIVSAINRDVEVDGRTMTLIQTNAALNSGNSGGPLINCYGQVIGINTMKIGAFTDSAGVEGLGFAIPSVTVKEIVDQLISQGYVSGRPTLGIGGDTLSSFYQHYYRMPAGLYITAVEEGSDAAAKGVQSGDLLLYIGQNRITSPDEMKAALYDRQVGETVQCIIYRQGQQYRVELTLTEDKG